MNTNFSLSIEQARLFQRIRPNYSAIARSLGVTPQHVRRVFLGDGTSARVMEAIQRDMRDRARESKKQRKVAA